MDHLDPAEDTGDKRRATLRDGRASLTATACRPRFKQYGDPAVRHAGRAERGVR
ncbi:DUF6380 family protein [Streptomyces sp. B93]|uniref:DUF6380 family protein n=1 Tax=Streptomyces sp. B93 TaxID=2824875 RepID=UPI0035A967F6